MLRGAFSLRCAAPRRPNRNLLLLQYRRTSMTRYRIYVRLDMRNLETKKLPWRRASYGNPVSYPLRTTQPPPKNSITKKVEPSPQFLIIQTGPVRISYAPYLESSIRPDEMVSKFEKQPSRVLVSCIV
jgi:hypothetical protein